MSRILLVDDDIAEISAVKRVLTRAGHQPVLATNAADAMAVLGQNRPDLVVFSATCDNGLAIGLARRLPQDPDMVGIPVLVLGDADELPQEVRRLPRPVDPELLTSEVKAALGSAGAVALEDGASSVSEETQRPASPKVPAAKGAAGKPAPAKAVAGSQPAKKAPIGRIQQPAVPAAPVPAPDKSPGRPSPPTPGTAARRPSPPPGAGAPAAAGGLADAAASRRAAAEALRARAEELRRSSQGSSPSAKPAGVGAPPAAATRARPGPAAIALDAIIPPAPPPARSSLAESLDLEGDDFDAALARATNQQVGDSPPDDEPQPAAPTPDQARREAAEEALRALEEETGTRDVGPAPARRAAPAPRREETSGAAEERALQEAIETARREAFEAAKRELQEQARQEAAEAARLVQAEARGRREEVAEVQRQAKDLARREVEASERARAAEQELQALRAQLVEERRRAEERVATVMQRAAEEEEAALQRFEGAQRDPRAGGSPIFTPPPFFAPFDGAEALPPAPAEKAARRRVAALRSGQPASSVEPPASSPDFPWSDPSRPPEPPDADPAPEPELPSRSIPQPVQQLRAGELGELPAPRLLALASRTRLDGRIDFRGEGARSLWFEDGRVVGSSSADPSERVEEVALRLGLVTRDQHRQTAQAAAALPCRRAALLLLERGFLKDSELTGLVRRRTEEVVFGVFADADARFRWVGEEVPPEERIGLERGTLALAVEGVRRRWQAPRVEALLGGPATLLAPATGAPPATELGLSPEERRVVALADGLRALDEIVQASPVDALTTRQVLAALVLVGALTIRSLQAGRPTARASAAIDLARVREKLEQVRRADYFTVLGVGKLCTPHEVREAADRLQVEFDPRRFAGQPDEGLPVRLAEILQVIQDAREVLADERLRDEYLRGLGDAG